MTSSQLVVTDQSRNDDKLNVLEFHKLQSSN